MDLEEKVILYKIKMIEEDCPHVYVVAKDLINNKNILINVDNTSTINLADSFNNEIDLGKILNEMTMKQIKIEYWNHLQITMQEWLDGTKTIEKN